LTIGGVFAAGMDDLDRWFEEGLRRGATHLIVVCDTFSREDFPVYVMPGESSREVAARYHGVEMHGVHEVYRLSLDKASQLAERRALHHD
jgi:hypothetical protein